MTTLVVTCEVTGNSAGLIAAMESSGAAVKSFKAESEAASASAGSGMKKAGVAMATGIAAGSIAAVKLASDFQETTTKLVTGAGESAKNLDKVKAGLQGMAGEVGMGPTALANAMFTVESAGYHGAAGLDVMKAAAEGAKVGGSDATTVANGLTTALKDYHLPASAAAAVTSQLVETVASGKTTMGDLSGSLSSVLPAASSAGIGLKQVLGALATMTGEGISAQESSQDLNSTIQSLSNPSTEASKAMAQMGLSSLDVSKNLGKNGLTGTMETLANAVTTHMGKSGLIIQSAMNQSKIAMQSARTEISQMPASLAKLSTGFLNGSVSQKDFSKALVDLPAKSATMGRQFEMTAKDAMGFSNSVKSGQGVYSTFNGMMSQMTGGATGLKTALALTGGNMSTFKSNVDGVAKAGDEGKKSVQGWEETQKDFKTQMDQLGGSMQSLGISVGSQLLPAFSKMVTSLQGAVKVVDAHKAAILPLIATFGSFAAAMVAVVSAMKVYESVSKAVTTAQKAYGDATKMVSSTVKGVGTAFKGVQTGVRAASAAFQEGGAIQKAYAATTTLLSKGMQAVKLAFTEGVIAQKAYAVQSAVTSAATKVWSAIQIAFNAIMDANPIAIVIIAIVALIAVIVLVITHWKQVVSFLTTTWSDAVKLFQAVGAQLAAWWTGFWNTIAAVASAIFHAAVAVVTGVWNTIVGVFASFGASVASAWNNVWNGLISTVKSIFGGAGTWLLDAGRNIVQGLINGVQNMVGSVVSTVKNMASSAVNAAKSFLGIHSPSTVFKELGGFVVAGLNQGISDKIESVRQTATKMSLAVTAAFNAKQISRSQANSLNDVIATDTNRLEKLTNERTSVATRLSAANKALAAAQSKYNNDVKAAQSYAANITSNLTGAVNASSAGSADLLVSQLTQQVSQEKQLQSALAQLSKEGLNKTTYDQLAQGGLDSLATAQSLASAGASKIKQVNSLTASASSTATAVGNTAAAGMYGSSEKMYAAGVHAAQGLVNGLKSQEAALTKQMDSLASTMVNGIKRALGIHSPSVVFHGLGLFTAQGMANGIDAGSALVNAAVQRMVTVPTTVSMPGASSGGSAAASSKTVHVTNSTTINTQATDPDAIARRVQQQQDLQTLIATGGE